MPDSNKNNSSLKIEIEKGMEHHSNLMNIYDENNFFYSSYHRAAYAITRIIEMSRIEQEKNSSRQWYENSYQSFEYHNNIVSFCADRGQGKTSAMLSMAEALRTIENRKNGRSEFWNSQPHNDSDNPVLHTHFECLSVIDPKSLEKDDSILRTLMSKMFKSASDAWNDSVRCPSSGYSHEEKQTREDLAKKFMKCFKTMNYLYEKKAENPYYDDLNMMAEYGDRNNLKSSFMELVDLYLKFMFSVHGHSDSSPDNAMMVVLIDDADLNTEYAYPIVEEIRKYFVIPKVLVLMALHIDTLAMTLEQYFLQQYKLIMDVRVDRSLIADRCHLAMERYITKLLPSSHRIYLPSIPQIFEKTMNRITLSYNENKNFREKDKDMFESYQYLAAGKLEDSYENRLFRLIYAKTGIVLTKQGDFLHQFLPNNFRQLNHFIFYLNGMEDIVSEETFRNNQCGLFESVLKDVHKEKREKKAAIAKSRLWLENLERFYDYFQHTWCQEQLPKNHSELIEIIDQASDDIKNFTALHHIRNTFNNEIFQNTNTFNNEIFQNTFPFATLSPPEKKYVPLSDVIWLLHYIEDAVMTKPVQLFVCAVKMYYTICLHIHALQSIINILESSDDNPQICFNSLYRLLGGRIFPMQYYNQKKLPFYLLDIDCDNLFIKYDKVKTVHKGISKRIRRFIYPCIPDGNGIIAAIPERSYYKKNHGSVRCTAFFFRRDKQAHGEEVHEYQLFDFMAPIVNLLYYPPNNNIPVDILPDAGEEQGDILPDAGEKQGLYSALHLICNLDVQEIVYQEFFCSPYTPSIRPTGNLFSIVNGIYKALDNIIDNKISIKISDTPFRSQLKVLGSNIRVADDNPIETIPSERIKFDQTSKSLNIVGMGIGENIQEFNGYSYFPAISSVPKKKLEQILRGSNELTDDDETNSDFPSTGNQQDQGTEKAGEENSVSDNKTNSNFLSASIMRDDSKDYMATLNEVIGEVDSKKMTNK